MKRDKNFQIQVDNLINNEVTSNAFLETAHARIRENAILKSGGKSIAESSQTDTAIAKKDNITRNRGRFAAFVVCIAAVIGAFVQWVRNKISGKND